MIPCFDLIDEKAENRGGTDFCCTDGESINLLKAGNRRRFNFVEESISSSELESRLEDELKFKYFSGVGVSVLELRSAERWVADDDNVLLGSHVAVLHKPAKEE